MGGILEVFGRPDFTELLVTHIELSVTALLIAIAIALPVALAVRNTPLGAALAINVGNIGRAVPSLAILALVLPFLGYGFDTALVALTALGIPPRAIASNVSDDDVFFHFTAIPGEGYRTLRPGMSVRFEIVESKAGLTAHNVQKDDV
jgi:cold shock CspA family protein